MTGSGSTSFNWLLYGGMAIVGESYLFDVLGFGLLVDSVPTWLFITLQLLLAMLIPSFVMYVCMGFLVSAVRAFVTGTEPAGYNRGGRDWVAAKSFVFLLVYFAAFYSDEETSKPDWLDWLG